MRRHATFAILIFFAVILAAGTTNSAQAQDFGIDVTIGVKKKIVKGLNVSLEGTVATQDKSSELDKLEIQAEIAYRPVKYVKIDAGYSFIERYKPRHTTDGGNTVMAYWSPRHRAFGSVAGILPVGDFAISLRERYQFTHRSRVTADKYDADGDPMADKVVAAQDAHILRSRLQFEWDVHGIPLTPYVSVEPHNDLADSFALDKLRCTVGADYVLDKKHTLSLFYRYDYEPDDDDMHLIGLGYEFKF